MGKSWRKVLLQGTESIQYGLVNDKICPQAAWDGVCLHGGCISNVIILSRQTLSMLHNMLPFNDADAVFTDKEANFHPYCPVILNEKWTISTAGMCWCFGEACSDSLTGYITCSGCHASSMWLSMNASLLTYCHWDQVHGLTGVWNF